MADNYVNIKGTMRPSFKISPNGVEIISKAVSNSALKELYIKRSSNNEHRILTEYDMEIPSRAIATYTEIETNEGQFVVFNLHNGETLRIPKTISNLEQAGTVIGPDHATEGNIVTYADSTGLNIDDRGHGILDNMSDSQHIDYSASKDVPTAKAVWNLVGEAKLLLYARLQGLLDSNGHTTESQASAESDVYRLDLEVNCLTEVPETFTKLFLMTSPIASEDSADYRYQLISDVDQRQYLYSEENISSDTMLSLKLAINDSELGVCYITDENGAHFTVIPDGNNVIKVIISFEYPTSEGNTTGIFSQEFGGETEYILSNNDKTIKERHIFYNSYVSERTVTISNISLNERNGQYILTLTSEGITASFSYVLEVDIDGETISYDVKDSSLVLSVVDSAKIRNAEVVNVTPVIWDHSLATFNVKGNE